MRNRLFTAVICASVAAAGLLGQQASAARPDDGPVIGTTTQEVMLDVVVRDRKGRMIRNLRADEIEVLDDGAPKKLRSFRAVGSAAESAESPASASRGTVPVQLARLKNGLNPMREARLVTLVFDQLLPGQRPFAKQAALELLKNPVDDLLFAVFKIDQKLALLESYTNDPERVRNAIERATNPSYFLNIDEENRIAKNQATAAVAEQLLGMKQISAGGGQVATTDQRIAQLTLNMLQFADGAELKQQSKAQLLALWALVREQKRMPGRKTVVYFSGGMTIPPEDNDRFNAIVSDANLANVTVYAIHAGGISTYLGNRSGNLLLAQAAASSRSNLIDRTGIVSVDQAQVFDRAEDSVHANTQNTLEVLTRDTGGFYSANTNDFKNPLKRLMEDVSFHYELTYSPGIDKYDGHLRKILVRVARPDVRVQTRSGYYAMPPSSFGQPGGQDVRTFEGPMLSALSMSAPAAPERAVSFRAEAKWFGGKTSVVVDVPIDQMAVASDEATGSFRMHLSVLGLFKDAAGGIVRKVSRDIPMKGRLENLDATRAGHFIFTEHVDLPPGHYTLETAVFDRGNLKVGTKKQVIAIPAARTGDLSVSSLSLVRKAVPAGETFDREGPFEFSGMKITPELNRTVKGGIDGRLGMYLVVYGQKGHPASLTIDFLQDGAVVARSEPPVPEPGEDGRIAVLAQVPIGGLKPGAYEVRARASQAGRFADERMLIEIE